jgi:reverse gyrase
MARVYELVVRHFIATVSRDAEWQATKVVLDVNVLEEFGKFTIRGKQVRIVSTILESDRVLPMTNQTVSYAMMFSYLSGTAYFARLLSSPSSQRLR